MLRFVITTNTICDKYYGENNREDIITTKLWTWNGITIYYMETWSCERTVRFEIKGKFKCGPGTDKNKLVTISSLNVLIKVFWFYKKSCVGESLDDVLLSSTSFHWSTKRNKTLNVRQEF